MKSRYADELTPREQEVLKLLATGLTNEEIARQLDISLDGVKYHVSGILRSLGVENRHDAALLHLRTEGGGRFAAWAPVIFLRKLPFGGLPHAAAGVVLTATAVGVGLLAWGVMSTSSPAVTTTSPTGCGAEQTAGSAPDCGPLVAPAAAGAGAISAISAAGGGTCALKDGGVWCWGANSNGYFGRGKGATTDSSAPVAVPGLASGVSAIAGAGGSGCAIKGGGVWCWTTYSRDDLGGSGLACVTHYPGCFGSSLYAVPELASGVTALSAGCAVKDGAAWCVGSNQTPNNNDQASADATAAACQFGACDIPVFVPVPGLESGVSAISVSAIGGANRFRCAVKDGGAWCWGINDLGQLGNDSTTDSLVPVAVSGLGSGVGAISVGTDHVCAVKGGGVWCWGSYWAGQLGRTAQSHVPAPVSGLESGVGAISAADHYTCALKAGGVWCWGANTNGQLGNNSTTESHVPVAVPGLGGGVSAISAGGDHSCAVTDAGAWCWGGNAVGQLGNNRPAGSDAPVAVSGLTSGVSAIEGTCALKGGGVWCWGSNSNGQLGNNSTTDSAVPVPVSGLASGVSAIRPGPCALKDGGFWCWGAIAAGEVVNSTTDSAVPVAVSELVAGVAPGTGGLCALKGGGVWCWGGSPAPVLERGLESGVSALSGCALKDGGVWCWSFGGNPNGGLNDVPVAVRGLESGVDAISPGCALKSGGVWCWGFGDELGGTTSPVLMSGLGSGVSAISGTCALKEGGVWCWVPNGFDSNGEYQVTVPVSMPGLESGVSAITAIAFGGEGGCALKEGGVWCWGDNSSGQLGNNSSAASLAPVAVQFPP
jgi:alpha-tubulin suppressor-like RCC1 family protein/DNA-binding CsgD family transcriptional regulator